MSHDIRCTTEELSEWAGHQAFWSRGAALADWVCCAAVCGDMFYKHMKRLKCHDVSVMTKSGMRYDAIDCLLCERRDLELVLIRYREDETTYEVTERDPLVSSLFRIMTRYKLLIFSRWRSDHGLLEQPLCIYASHSNGPIYLLSKWEFEEFQDRREAEEYNLRVVTTTNKLRVRK